MTSFAHSFAASQLIISIFLKFHFPAHPFGILNFHVFINLSVILIKFLANFEFNNKLLQFKPKLNFSECLPIKDIRNFMQLTIYSDRNSVD